MGIGGAIKQFFSSPQRKVLVRDIIILLASIAVTFGLYPVLNYYFARTASITLSLPVIVAALLWGLRVGIIATAAASVTYIPVIYMIFEKDPWANYMHQGTWVGLAMTLIVCIVIGRDHDLTAKIRALNMKLSEQAKTDELTGLMNRRALLEAATIEIFRAKRQRADLDFFLKEGVAATPAQNDFKAKQRPEAYYGRFALAVVDIDNFKSINDTYGHLIGDRVLRAIAVLMRKTFRLTDIVGRYGGEEFLVIFPNTSAENARFAIDHVAATLRKERFTDDAGKIFTVSFSAGLSELTPEDADIDAVIKRADEALYRAKDAGRDRWVIWSLPPTEKRA
ncbi:MAG: diguanylate cyclase [Spirochaetota bacterium]